MKSGRLLCVVTVVLGVGGALFPLHAAAQQHPTAEEYVDIFGGTIVAPGKFEIDGRPVTCEARPTVLDTHLNDAVAAPPQFIVVNPDRLMKLPPSLRVWAYDVACGFALLGRNQASADCYATKRGRKAGWLTDEEVDRICALVRPSARGPFNEVPGPQRCQRIRNCYRDNK
jgi:hypothetical protein